MQNKSLDFQQGGYVCKHLFDNNSLDVHRQFTSVGVNYNLICSDCAKHLNDLPDNLVSPSMMQFQEIDRIFTEFAIGSPEILRRQSRLGFSHEIITLEKSLSSSIVDIQPSHEANLWISILANGLIVKINLVHKTYEIVFEIPSHVFILTDKAAIHISKNDRFVAVVNNRADKGIVIDLVANQITMPLNRGDYYPEQTDFPITFFQLNGQTLIVHGTKWNRLDISDPLTGKLLTERQITWIEGDPKPPEHYLDYFHSLPVVSPTAEWIAEDGWVWGPFRVVTVWSLPRWINQNVFESEDGRSYKRLTKCSYCENSNPLCWINDKTLAVWGFGDDDTNIISACQIFDVETGQRIRLFAGPQNAKWFFDEYLFASSKQDLEVWDIATGEMLFHEPDFSPYAYHPITHQFLSILPGVGFRISQLINPV